MFVPFRSLRRLAAGGAVLAALALAPSAPAAMLGVDNANNYTTATWINGSNGGTGFGTWTLTNNNGGANFAGYLIQDSTANSSGNGNLNTNAKAFGMFANPSGAFANADRTFAGGALTLNQTFSLQLAVNFRNGSKGMNLYASGTQIFNFNIGNNAGVDGYYYTVGTGAVTNTNLAYAADSVFTLSYTQQNATAGLFTISRTSAATPGVNGTVNVPFTSSGVTSFRVYNSNATNSNSDNVFFNNLAIVPEPSSYAFVVGLAGGAFLLRRRTSVRS